MNEKKTVTYYQVWTVSDRDTDLELVAGFKYEDQAEIFLITALFGQGTVRPAEAKVKTPRKTPAAPGKKPDECSRCGDDLEALALTFDEHLDLKWLCSFCRTEVVKNVKPKKAPTPVERVTLPPLPPVKPKRVLIYLKGCKDETCNGCYRDA